MSGLEYTGLGFLIGYMIGSVILGVILALLVWRNPGVRLDYKLFVIDIRRQQTEGTSVEKEITR